MLVGDDADVFNPETTLGIPDNVLARNVEDHAPVPKDDLARTRKSCAVEGAKFGTVTDKPAETPSFNVVQVDLEAGLYWIS